MYSKLNTKEEIVIGEISNFDIVGSRDSLWLKPQIYIKTNTGNKYKVESILGSGGFGNTRNRKYI